MVEDVAEDVLKVDMAIKMDVAGAMTGQLLSMVLMFQILQGTLQVLSGKPCSTMVEELTSCKPENGWTGAVDEVDEEEIVMDADGDEISNSAMLQQRTCKHRNIKQMRWMHVMIRALKLDVVSKEVTTARIWSEYLSLLTA